VLQRAFLIIRKVFAYSLPNTSYIEASDIVEVLGVDTCQLNIDRNRLLHRGRQEASWYHVYSLFFFIDQSTHEFVPDLVFPVDNTAAVVCNFYIT
jgi:hypothetical protein